MCLCDFLQGYFLGRELKHGKLLISCGRSGREKNCECVGVCGGVWVCRCVLVHLGC